MQTVYLKEYEGMSENTTGQLSSGHAMPWWISGSRSVPSGSFGHLKSSSVETPNQFTLTKSDHLGLVKGDEKGGVNQFTIFAGEQKSQQVRPSMTIQSSLPESNPHFESGFVYPKYPYGDQAHGVLTQYIPQVTYQQGRVLLPLNPTTDDGPIYVNAKQYNGIIRRRQTRAKAELVNKSVRARKPYLHESRHLHAMRRPRGCGGRFLNSKKLEAERERKSMKSVDNAPLGQPTGSPSSGVFQSDNGTLNSPKQATSDISTISGSEATSLYSMRDLRCFTTNFLAQSLPSMMDSGHGIVARSHWVAGPQNCCNLNV